MLNVYVSLVVNFQMRLVQIVTTPLHQDHTMTPLQLVKSLKLKMQFFGANVTNGHDLEKLFRGVALLIRYLLTDHRGSCSQIIMSAR